jgi:regulation of enolase protein 1 (concanavalin A-like superfamily)
MSKRFFGFKVSVSAGWVAIFVATFCFSALAQPLGGKIGVNVEDASSGARGKTWVDLSKGSQYPFVVGQYGTATPIDANGFPTTDAEVYFANYQIVAEWTSFIDDPQTRRINLAGTYKLSFKGQADLSGFESLTFANKVYDSATNTTTADVTVPNSARVISIVFSNSKRTPQSAVNTGITDYRLISPGFPANTTQIFTNELTIALKPFRTIRFLNWDSVNNNDPVFPQVTNWSDRHLPTDASQDKVGKKFGVAWEYMILLCNQTNKDLWINIPASATDDYVRQLSLLIRDGNAFTGGKGLKPNLKIYVEHSNEVWNDGFTQKVYNQAATQAELTAGNSPLNNDGETNIAELSRRRHAKRTREFLNIFAQTFGTTEINSRIRGVYAHEIASFAEIQRVLNWMNTTYGPPRNYFYSVAVNPYFTWFNAFGGTIPNILQSFRDQATSNAVLTNSLIPILRTYNLKMTAYEGGTISADFAPFGQASAVGNGILAERTADMRDIVKFAVKDKWFDLDRDVMDSYNYFTLSSAFTRFGCYGLVEDFANMNTPKYLAMTDLLGNGTDLPDDWVSEDVGNTLSGSAAFNAGTFTVRGGGNGVWNTKDDFRYVYKFLGIRPNLTVTARVASLDNTSSSAKAGLMIRTSFADNTSEASVSLTPSNNTTFQLRAATDKDTQTVNGITAQAPYWVRLQKRGSSISGYVSADGVNWIKTGNAKIVIGAKVTAGFFVASQSRNLISQATFDNVSIR